MRRDIHHCQRVLELAQAVSPDELRKGGFWTKQKFKKNENSLNTYFKDYKIEKF
jgi:hypothetical protein